MRKQNTLHPVVRILPLIVLMIIILFLINACGSSGGSGNSDSADDSFGALHANVVMGPVVGATVRLAPLEDRNNFFTTGTTEDADDLNAAGGIVIDAIPEAYLDTPLFVHVSGGTDIDADDDGVRDPETTENGIVLEFAIPTATDLSGLTLNTVFNPLLLFASDYVFQNIDSGYEPSVENVKIVLRRVARAILSADIDGDGAINWQDIICFHPLEDQSKCRIPWDYIVDRIERSRQAYYASLDLHYTRAYKFDPGTLAPIDHNGNGTWKDDLFDEKDKSFCLDFITNKNGYTSQDLYEAQGGNRGGAVQFPEDKIVSYYYDYPWDGGAIFGEEHDTNIVPLDLRGSIGEGWIRAQAGGNVIDPDNAPVGEYKVTYAADGLEHVETLYVFENSDQTLFYAIPEISLDENGFIDTLKLRFEDIEGNLIEDPPFLSGVCQFQAWDVISTVNTLLRGSGFYTDPYGRSNENEECYLYDAPINLADPTATYSPRNNGHKIYFEDLTGINLWFYCGDGVTRAQPFSPHFGYYPYFTTFEIADNIISAGYTPSPETDREVVATKYRFDNTAWTETTGASIKIEIPDGATKVYITAKDTSGFYRYPPDERDLN